MSALRWMAGVGLGLCLCAAPAQADQGMLFGFGEGLATAGGGRLLGDNAWAAWSNPAAMGLLPHNQLALSVQVGSLQLQDWGWIAQDTDLDGRIEPRIEERDGEQVVVDQQTAEQAGISYDAPQGLHIGFVKTLGPWLRAGVAISLPFTRLVRVVQNDPAFPYYPRWRSRPQRFQGAVALSARPFRGIYLGGGVSLLARARIGAEFDLEVVVSDSEEEGQDPTLDFVVNPASIDADIRLAVAPLLSFVLDFELFHPAVQGLRLGVTWRAPIELRVEPAFLGLNLNVDSDVEGIEGLVGLVRADIFFSIVDYYTPGQVDFSLAWDRGPVGAFFDVRWARWSRLVPSVARVLEEESQIDISLADLEPGATNARPLPEGIFRDTWSISAGAELRPPALPLANRLRSLAFKLRFGYSYDPTFVALQTGSTSILDTDVHTIGAGIGLETWDPFGWFAGPLSFDLAFQYKHLPQDVHIKDEQPDGLARPAGYPMGYAPDGSDGQGQLVSGGRILLGSFTLGIRY